MTSSFHLLVFRSSREQLSTYEKILSFFKFLELLLSKTLRKSLLNNQSRWFYRPPPPLPNPVPVPWPAPTSIPIPTPIPIPIPNPPPPPPIPCPPPTANPPPPPPPPAPLRFWSVWVGLIYSIKIKAHTYIGINGSSTRQFELVSTQLRTL